MFGDPQRLQQVVWNLLSNSIKFTPRSGTIDVLLRRVASHVEIRVTDSGIGIAPDFLPHVFERFRQADATTTRRHGGLGLGLSIVRYIAEAHGGTVTAESPGRGKGGDYLNARGLSVRAWNRPLDEMFLRKGRGPRPVTIGVALE